MPKRRYKWWSSVISAMREDGNVYVEAALKVAEKRFSKFDYDIVVDCLERRYIRKTRTLFQIALDHGTTENVAWYATKKFIFLVAEEMGYLKKHSQ